MHQKFEDLQKRAEVFIGQIVIYKNNIYEVLDIERDGDLVLGRNEDAEIEASPKDCFIS